ncbi:MAG: hypothetical protein AB1584_16055 [Pseudomonadota bacterium]
MPELLRESRESLHRPSWQSLSRSACKTVRARDAASKTAGLDGKTLHAAMAVLLGLPGVRCYYLPASASIAAPAA